MIFIPHTDQVKNDYFIFQDHDVEGELHERVLSHYKYLYVRTRGINPKVMFDALPQTLWGDLCVELYKNFIEEVRYCSYEVITSSLNRNPILSIVLFAFYLFVILLYVCFYVYMYVCLYICICRCELSLL